MRKTDETTPIINIIFSSKDKSNQYIKDNMQIMFARGKKSSVEYHKVKLGKQNYCWLGSVRHWIWEGNNWRVYVSKRGAAFEVLSNLTVDEAWGAWQDYFNKIR